MDINEASKFISKRITELEQTVYTFENVMLPRLEQDKKILEQLRGQKVKILMIKQRVDSGEEVSTDDIYQAIPEALR